MNEGKSLFDQAMDHAEAFIAKYPRQDGQPDPMGICMHAVCFLLNEKGATGEELDQVAALFGVTEGRIITRGFSAGFSRGWDAAIDAAVGEIQKAGAGV